LGKYLWFLLTQYSADCRAAFAKNLSGLICVCVCVGMLSSLTFKTFKVIFDLLLDKEAGM